MILVLLLIIAMIPISGCDCDEEDPVDTSYLKDSDSDGILDYVERELGTDPNNPDTDGDGVGNLRELLEEGRDPLGLDEADDPVADKLMPYGAITYTVNSKSASH